MVCVMFKDDEGIVRYCSEPMAWARMEGASVRVPGGEITPSDSLRVEICEADDAIGASLGPQYALVSEKIPGGMRVRPVEMNSGLEEF